MNVPCVHWSDNGRGKEGGLCAAGISGGLPSFGKCAACEHINKSLADIPKTATIRMRKKGCVDCKPITIQGSTNPRNKIIGR